jgi:DNA-binding IclR family transcriptional regulator
MPQDRGVDAVERAFQVLECFRGDEDSLTLAQLAERSGLYKSTILRIAVSLERFGYMTRQADGRYRLGATLWRLGAQYRRQFDLAETVRPILLRIVEATTETASYYVRDGASRVCLYRAESPRAMRHHLTEGARLPLEGGASARVLRAWSPFARPEDGVVRANGFAVSLGERDPEVAAVAVPVFGPGNGDELRGALAVSGLITRFDDAAVLRAREALASGARALAGSIAET